MNRGCSLDRRHPEIVQRHDLAHVELLIEDGLQSESNRTEGMATMKANCNRRRCGMVLVYLPTKRKGRNLRTEGTEATKDCRNVAKRTFAGTDTLDASDHLIPENSSFQW
jgi:hypothetical protein